MQLNELCSFLDTAYDINSGGCCYVSYLISKELEKLGIEYKLILYDEEFEDYEDQEYVQKAIKERNLFCTGCGDFVSGHYAIVVDDLIINPSRYDDETSITVSVNSKDIQWLYETGDWNECYNISLNAILRNYIHTFFNAFKIQQL